jgi:hypothetical protein
MWHTYLLGSGVRRGQMSATRRGLRAPVAFDDANDAAGGLFLGGAGLGVEKLRFACENFQPFFALFFRILDVVVFKRSWTKA